jgi:hypothetical protein
MREPYRLERRNDELLASLSTLVRRGNDLTADVLAHLAELGERRLYLELGFSSLFAYCTESLGMSESAAGRRIAAARVCRRYPEAFARVARGELHLSALCSLGPCLNQENAAELFDACSRRSSRQVEELLAARFPKPDIRDSIRRLPQRAEAGVESNVQIEPSSNGVHASATIPARDKQELASEGPLLVSVSDAPVPSAAAPALGARAQSSSRVTLEPLSADRFGVRFTADTEFRDLLARVRALASHRLPNADLPSLIKLALNAYLRELEKTRFGVGRKPRVAAPATAGPTARSAVPSRKLEPAAMQAIQEGAEPDAPEPGSAPISAPTSKSLPTVGSKTKRSRHVPAAVTREVYLRDERQCTFVAKDGRRCAARHFLELDHVQPWALGGASDAGNLRLRCRAHNQLHARKLFGRRYMTVAVTRSRATGKGAPQSEA